MSAHPVRRAFVAYLLVSTFSVAGCGSDEAGGPLGANTFGGMHEMALMEECDKTVQCKVQRGETLKKDDPVGQCVLDTAELLNDDEDRQESFLNNYDRCRAFPVCDYVMCAESDGMTYGDTQRDKIRSACSAQVDCNTVEATPGDGTMVCEEKMVNQLNRYVPTRQNAWETAYDACKDQIGCGFMNCFCMGFFQMPSCVLGM